MELLRIFYMLTRGRAIPVSDNSLPLSSAAASFKALAQRLDEDFEPEDASGGRLPSLRSKGARNSACSCPILPVSCQQFSTPDQTLTSLLRNAGDMDDIESSNLSDREDIFEPSNVEQQSHRTPDNVSPSYQARDGSPSPPSRRSSSRQQEPSPDRLSRGKRSSTFYSKDKLEQIREYRSLPKFPVT